MPIERTPVASSLDPVEFSAGVVTKGPTALNTLWSRYADGRVYASQRPAVNIIGLAGDRSLPSKGRGIVYWDKVAGEVSNGIYFINDNVVYAGSYDNPLPDQITTGRDPVYFVEVGRFLVILDPENNQGWYISAASPEQLFRITDVDFPGITSNSRLAGGGAELDGILYVMDTDGNIYNSGSNDPTTWNSLDFQEAQREQDAGVFLTKHHDNIVAIGSNSMEFFYNAGNPTGSPLQRRPDIAYRTGGLDRRTVFTSGERLYFIGSEKIGTPGLWELSGFRLNKVSPDSIDRFLADTRVTNLYRFNMTGGYIGEHYMTFITVLQPDNDNGTYTPVFTFFYDATQKVYGEFDTEIASVQNFGMAGISERSAILRGESVILFTSGDLAVFDMSGSVLDRSGEDQYVVDDYIVDQDAYVTGGIADNQVNIKMQITFNESDFGTYTNKFMSRFAIVGDSVGADADETAPILVSWSDDHYRTFTTPRFYETGERRSLTRLGKFKRRAFRLDYQGEERMRLEELEFDITGSEFA